MSSSAPPRAPREPVGPDSLEITEVKIRVADGSDENILKAYASITLNGCLAIHNLKIIHGGRGLFVSMPARRNKSNGFSDIVHPTTQPFRAYLESVVIGAYERQVGETSHDAEY
jgi:stage V sporulation protein G